VREAAVVAVPHPRRGERPVAAVVLRPGAAADEAALRAHVAERVHQGGISKYAMQVHRQIVDALARTSVGKLDKKAMRARFGV
jgi:fatty-acyl-CoA synthase